MPELRVQPETELPPAKSGGSGRRWGIWLAALGIAFLVGFVPMWLSSRTLNENLTRTSRDLRRSQLQNTLASAVLDARRGEYESSRQSASKFFSEIQSQLDSGTTEFLGEQEKPRIASALGSRDEIITLLSRSDPAATERLSDLYIAYENATSGTAP